MRHFWFIRILKGKLTLSTKKFKRRREEVTWKEVGKFLSLSQRLVLMRNLLSTYILLIECIAIEVTKVSKTSYLTCW